MGGTTPTVVTCGAVDYVAPAEPGDFGCQDFDGEWPPENPWMLTEVSGGFALVQSPLVSPPNAIALQVPSSGAANARLTFRNASGDDLESVLLLFQFNQAPFAAPLLWDDPMKLACVRIGSTEGCLQFQRGEGYSISVALDGNVGPPIVCDYAGSPAQNSWNDISIKIDNTGQVTAFIEHNSEVTCQGPSAIGTVATAWIGMDGPSGGRSEYEVSIDNVVVLATRH